MKDDVGLALKWINYDVVYKSLLHNVTEDAANQIDFVPLTELIPFIDYLYVDRANPYLYGALKGMVNAKQN